MHGKMVKEGIRHSHHNCKAQPHISELNQEKADALLAISYAYSIDGSTQNHGCSCGGLHYSVKHAFLPQNAFE